MNNVIRFDRNEVFTEEMMDTLKELIIDVSIGDKWSFDFINALYGMYDGYLYPDILTMAMEYPSDVYERVLDLYREIRESVE